MTRSNVTIYHNPRCTKSRQTLDLLREQGVEPDIVRYLDAPPDADTLRDLLTKLGLAPMDIIRRKEAAFAELRLADKADDPDALIDAMVAHPILIERPIVVKGKRARLGRPPEKVLELL
ncbi:MAG: arsenate reductase (glutaredoxin) [Phycisphaera sp.]|nr:arsenate reductase (glutaredoxin) [Phycisphaera sp.]